MRATRRDHDGAMSSLVLPPRRVLLRGVAASALSLPFGSLFAAPRRSTVEVTEGPFFVDEHLNRFDLRVDPVDGSVQPGLTLQLALHVAALDGATGITRPLQGIAVDLWQCNRHGRYSDVEGSEGHRFLRGYQVSDERGRVAFQTIFPGWYEGRAPHIHCKLRGLQGGELTTQFFFDEATTRRIYTDPALPYLARGLPDTALADDGVYAGPNGCAPGERAGDSLKLDLRGDSHRAVASFQLLVDEKARCRSHETRPPGPPPGRPPRRPTPWI